MTKDEQLLLVDASARAYAAWELAFGLLTAIVELKLMSPQQVRELVDGLSLRAEQQAGEAHPIRRVGAQASQAIYLEALRGIDEHYGKPKP